MQGTFKKDTSYEKRVQLFNRLRLQFDDRLPIIVEVAKGCQLKLHKHKFLVPQTITMGGLLTEIRKQTKLRKSEALFLFCGKKHALVPTSCTLSQIHSRYKDDDGFLYITVALENTFGTLHTIERVAGEILDNVLTTSSNIVKIFS